MKITFYDGSTAQCEEIEFFNDVIMWDHCRYTPVCEVEKIEED